VVRWMMREITLADPSGYRVVLENLDGDIEEIVCRVTERGDVEAIRPELDVLMASPALSHQVAAAVLAVHRAHTMGGDSA
jgi:hypothetical protein